MSVPKFIQISMLSSYPAALLNRDDSGLAKRIRFGGAMRTRVSSQCLKRHWRMADDPYSLANVDPSLTLSIRSRETFNRVLLPMLVERGFAEDAAVAVLSAFQKALYEGKDKADKEATQKGDKHPLVRSEVVVLGRAEIEFLAQRAGAILERAAEEAGADAKALVKTAAALAKDYLKDKDVKKNWQALTCGAGLDAAMFGRFVSGDPEARVNAAVHVAHALTVHAESSETDYFTAVDDLTTSSEGGSGHLGAAELTSGLYYSYVVVDVPQLVSNITGAEASAWLDADRTLAARTVKHLIHLMATVSPGAKLGSTAPYDHASFVLAEAGDRQPRTLANAFLAPVSFDRTLFPDTLRALSGYLEGMDGMYGQEEARWLACRVPTDELAGFGAQRMNLPALAEVVETAIREGK